MKKLLLVLVSILLFSCSGNLDLSSDDFYKKNVTTFEVGDYLEEGLVALNDKAQIKRIYKLINQDFSEKSLEGLMEYGGLYLYSWQENNRNFKEFTVIIKNEDCDNSMYYIILNQAGELLASRIVAQYYGCGDIISKITTVFTDKSNFELRYLENGHYELFKDESVTQCAITDVGSFTCDSMINLVSSVCLWEKLTIKTTPEEKGDYVTSVQQGEAFYYLGESKNDEASSKKVQYDKVQLSDGTVGWVQDRFIASPALAAVIIKDSYLYSRADEVTKTDTKFSKMDIVGITGTTEFTGPEDREWYKVKGKPSGENWFKEGWIKSTDISDYSVDVSTAMLAKKAIQENDLGKRKSLINDILNNTSLQHSEFISDLKSLAGNKLNNPKEIIAKIGTTWISLTEQEGEWVILDECRYGSGGFGFNEDGNDIYFTGGGDQWGHRINKLEETEEGYFMELGSVYDESIDWQVKFNIDENGIMRYQKIGASYEERYILNEKSGNVPTIEEHPCDD